MEQISLFALDRKLAGKVLRASKFLQTMNRVIPWPSLCEAIEPHYQGKAATGRKAMPMERMLRIYFLQQWYGLSDPEAEDGIYDRRSFQQFLGLDPATDLVPDETTILNFRHLLEAHQLQERFFQIIQEHLGQQGLQLKRGTIVDATLIAAPSSTKNAQKQRDPEMSSTKKNNQWHFGMKASIGVDARSGVVHSVKTGTAKTHDSRLLADCLHGREEALFGDKGYADQERKRQCRQTGLYYGILDKAGRDRALSGRQKQRNRQLASVRAKVEHPFQVIKCQWKYRKVRYRGLLKKTAQLFTLFGLYNLFKVRGQLLKLNPA
jgi:transposase, IS5 family